MLKVRIIPCLDIKDGKVVKGKGFVDLDDVGSPVQLAQKYNLAGADELCFLDINASFEGRKTTFDIVREVAETCFVPLTVGGGVNSLSDIEHLLKCGADKVSINSSAVKNPNFIELASKTFGSQCITVAIDAKLVDEKYMVFTHGGRNKTNLEAGSWAKTCDSLGCGEILLTSIDSDGNKNGYNLPLISLVRKNTKVPIIASGGVGKLEHFLSGIKAGASGLLAASIFHYNQITISQIKDYLKENNIPTRNNN